MGAPNTSAPRDVGEEVQLVQRRLDQFAAHARAIGHRLVEIPQRHGAPARREIHRRPCGRRAICGAVPPAAETGLSVSSSGSSAISRILTARIVRASVSPIARSPGGRSRAARSPCAHARHCAHSRDRRARFRARVRSWPSLASEVSMVLISCRFGARSRRASASLRRCLACRSSRRVVARVGAAGVLAAPARFSSQPA